MSRPIAVVTGAGSGIGAAISIELATRGFSVVPTDVDEESAARTAEKCGAEGSYKLDVTDAGGIDKTVRRIVEGHGPLAVWVSNAGVSKMRPFLEITPDELDFTLDVNLRGLFLSSQSAAKAMVKAGDGGCIVNIASMAGKQGRAVPFRLYRTEVRHRRPDPGNGLRTRALRHTREQRLPRLCRNSDARTRAWLGGRPARNDCR